MDATLMGLPVVTLVGKEPLTRLDYRILKSLGVEGPFLANNHEEYITNAIRLIENHALRYQLSQEILARKPEQIFEQETAKFKNELGDLISELYDQKYSK